MEKLLQKILQNTVLLEADSVIVLNVEDDVKISASEILFYGGKLTFDSDNFNKRRWNN